MKRAYRGIAASAALSAVPEPRGDKRYSVGVGYGHFAGSDAIAFGAKARLNNISAAVGGAFSGGEETVNVGLGYSW